MVADQRGGYVEAVHHAAQSLAGPLYDIAAAPSEIARGVAENFSERRTLARENRELREQLLLLQARLTRLDATQDENTRLSRLLDARERVGLSAQLAHLIDVTLDPFRQRVLIDRGSDDGVHEGQAVMDERGVLGQVRSVEAGRAELVLITDASHALPVRVARTGLRTIALGTGEGEELRLPYIPYSADVREGDVLVTSGMGGRFPPGLAVASIRSVKQGDVGTFAVALARPSADLAHARLVLLLRETREALEFPDGERAEWQGPPEQLSNTGTGTPATAEPAQ
jgi:rod shape-determining protein MreC